MSPNYKIFIDERDGKSYKTVKISGRVWMAENIAFKTEQGCWAFNHDEDKVEQYGYFYNWESAKNVLPTGWRLPTKEDFESLLKIGGNSEKKAYKALTENGHSGFNALANGSCDDGGIFITEYSDANFWSSTMASDGYIYYLQLNYEEKATLNQINKRNIAFSVRGVLNDN